jgi:hypothetical protein
MVHPLSAVHGTILVVSVEGIGGRLRISGSLVSTRQDDTEAYTVSYSLVIDETGMAQRLTVCTTRAQGKQYVTLTRSEESIWLVDHKVDRDVSTVSMAW